MSVTTGEDDKWEFSKENIQPLQRGRKPEILKLALRENPEEDPIQQQQQVFENELRTYSGDDPLSVWFKYIGWVEQNFVKGGRDGHLEHLIRKCVSMFKDEEKYRDDKRFVAIWLKFACISVKPTDVYSFMFSHNIGCYTASFYSAWSWELEQQGNISKANQVLYEGINRNADPVQSLRSYLSEFEIRISRKVTEQRTAEFLRPEPSVDVENQRSAFNIIRTHRNSVPVERIGETVAEPTRKAMTLGNRQPAPKTANESSSKLPFKIFGNKEVSSSLPVQSVGNVPFVFHSDSVKENELKPSKWNKARVKQSIYQPVVSKELGFELHRDETPQPLCTPRSVPKVSNVLRSHSNTKSIAMALFEPADPMKCPMYDRDKVYGGAEEFSLEEIRAAAWMKKQNLLDFKMDLSRLKESSSNVKACTERNQQASVLKQQKPSEKYYEPLRAVLSPINPLKCPIYDRDLFYKSKDEQSFEEIKAKVWFEQEKELLENSENICGDYKNQSSQMFLNHSNVHKFNTENEIKVPNNQNSNFNKQFENIASDSYCGAPNHSGHSQGKCSNSTSYCEAANMLAELYNGTIANPVETILKNEVLLASENNLSSYDIKYDSRSETKSDTNKVGLPFTVFHDPTENLFTSKEKVDSNKINLPYTENLVLASEADINSSYDMKYNDSRTYETKADLKKDLPFVVFQDPTENNFEKNNSLLATGYLKNNLQSKSILSSTAYADPTNERPLNNLTPDTVPEELSDDENSENVPPKDYVQDTSKRQLSGILTPAENIIYIPLELQKCLENQPDPEDECINNEELQNKTLFPLCNTEQFVSDVHTSSTPYTSARNVKKSNLLISEDTYNYGQVTKSGTTETGVASASQLVEAEKQAHRSEKISCAVRPVSSLSVIMETSKESYKSSASSGSSASVTKLSQYDQYHSYERSSNVTHKECSRADTFKEPKPLGPECTLPNKKSVNVSEVHQMEKLTLYGNVEDPFDNEFTDGLLRSLSKPPRYHKVLDVSGTNYRYLKVNDKFEIKKVQYLIENQIAEGAYGKVFVAEKQSAGDEYSLVCPKVVLKACRGSNEWELYVCFTLHERLLQIRSIPDVRLSVMDVRAAKKFNDGIVLITEYCPQGTLLDLVNIFKKERQTVPESLSLYLAFELLQIMSKIHECKVIHTDMKPDNVLVRNIDPDEFEWLNGDTEKTSLLQFIDFGRSIDLNFFETGICFNTPLKNRGIEVLEGKPWVFQPDWCGILDCIHILLFQEYMKVKKTETGRWGIENRFKRYQAGEIWSPLFDELLNIPTCHKEPNISEHLIRIRTKLLHTSTNFKSILNRIKTFYLQK